MSKENTYTVNKNAQAAFEYALYMIASSYFEKATCESPLQEQKLFLYYKEQKLQTQYDMENDCIRYMEKELSKKLPKGIWSEEVTVTMIKLPHCPLTEIRLQSPNFVLCLKGLYQGKKNQLFHSFWAKEMEPSR